MRILVDTQCWIWMLATPDRLGPVGRGIVASYEHELLLSAASAWEISIKYALGKLTLPAPPLECVPALLARSGVTALPILHHHALRVGTLPPVHRDPFDRVLVAQAQAEDLLLLTADRIFERYDVKLLPAWS